MVHYKFTVHMKQTPFEKIILPYKYKVNCTSLFFYKYKLPAYGIRGGQLSRYSDSLRAGPSGDRILVRARYSAPVQTGPGPTQPPVTMGTRSFPGLKWSGRGADHKLLTAIPPPPLCACIGLSTSRGDFPYMCY